MDRFLRRIVCSAVACDMWNSLVKGKQDKYVGMLLIALGHVPPGVIFVFFAPLPGMDVLPWLGASLASPGLSDIFGSKLPCW